MFGRVCCYCVFASILLALPSTVISASQENWQSIGPYGGRISSIAIAASNEDILYAGTWEGGVYTSTNNGEYWSSLGLRGKVVTSIAVDPNSSDVLYADYWDYTGRYPVEGELSKSVDGGLNWTPVFASRGIIVTHPKLSEVLYFAEIGGLYRSFDAGQNWEKVDYEFGLNNVLTVAVNAGDPHIVFVGTEAAVYRSTDDCETWLEVLKVFHYSNPNGFVSSIDISPVNGDAVIVGTWHDGVYISTDGGLTWIKSMDEGCQVRSVLVDPYDSSIFYAGTLCHFFRSTDSGANWRSLLSVRSIGSAISDDAVFLLDEGGKGILKSTDSGATWEEANAGISNGVVHSIVADPSDAARIISAISLGYSMKILGSEDSSEEWEILEENIHSNIGSRLFADSIDSLLYAVGGWYDFSISEDGGRSWQASNAGIPYMTCVDLAIDPVNSTLFIAGITAFEGLDAGIYKFTHGGQNWEQSSEGLPLVERFCLGTTKWGPIDIYSIAVDPNETRRLYAGAYEGLFTTTDAGSQWAKAHEFESKCVTEIAVHPEISNNVFAVAGGDVYKSADFGSTFVQLALPPKSVQTLFFDLLAFNVLYAGGEDGVYRSVDGGETWEILDDDLRDLTVSCLLADSERQILYAGTTGGGVFKRDRPGVWMIKGDVSGDGRINILDVMDAVNIILGLFEPTSGQFWAADYNGDAAVNVLDIVAIVGHIIENPKL